MAVLDFYIRVAQVLDEIGAPYMIVGAFGGYPFGITRVTFLKTVTISIDPQCIKTG
jgi:hypothetical protein